jgi:outer membrane protein OmpA-like peptidoglycan-associated protein
VERAAILGDAAPYARLVFAFADDPLVTRDEGGDEAVAIVEDQLGIHVSLGLSLIDRVHLAVTMPLYLQSTHAAEASSVEPLPNPGSSGAGDPTLDLRFTVLGQDDPIELAFAASLRLPVGNAGALAADDGFTAIPRVILSRAFADDGGYVSFSAGLAVRQPAQYGDLRLGNEMVFAVGVLVPVSGAFGMTLEAAGSTVLVEAFDETHTPLEAMLGLRYDADVGLTGMLGGGAGLTRGYGAPDYRMIGAVGYAPPELPPEPPPEDPDRDRDGVRNFDDECPDDAEDRDGFRDDDGCPEPDNDGDLIADAADECPTDPEDRDGFEDADGCADPDNDGDGILDPADQCIADPEDRDDWRDGDGCPEADNDGDGFPDAQDQCPLEAETVNEVADDDGCPDLVRVDRETAQIRILEPVFFATNRDAILDRSFPMLEEMVRVITEHPEIGRVAIEGHTDDRGRDARNLDLSNRRAQSVMRFLVEHGIPADRLTAQGFGETRPAAPNTTSEGRAQNRRVEFRLIDLAASAPEPAPAPAPESASPPVP